MNISMSDKQLLKFIIENGMIDTALVQDKIEMQKRKEYLEKHNYKIWEGTNGKCYTYLPGKENKRVLKVRNTQKEIENVVINYYKEIEETPIFSKIFYEWINKKLDYGEIQKQTYDRYETDFERFFRESKLLKRDIRTITEDELEDEIKSIISQKKLTNKAYSGLRTIINGMFKYAKKKKYSDISMTNFFGDIDISKKSFKKIVKSDKDSIFTDEEVLKIALYIRSNETLINLGILLAFQTGLRVGELAALKPSDINGSLLTVNKTEIRYKDANKKYVFEVRESAKTDAGNRTVILNSDAIETINKIRRLNPFGEYLFMENGERIKEKAFTVKLTKICGYVMINKRSMHKARKTYATKLINGNVDERIIIKQMGHTDISCTKDYYYFDNKSEEEARKQIEKAVVYV